MPWRQIWRNFRIFVDKPISILVCFYADKNSDTGKKLKMDKILRNEERRQLYKRLREYAATKILNKHTIEKWDYTEIGRECGIPSNRLTEIVKVENYTKNNPLSENVFILLLEGKVLDMTEIRQNVVQNDSEAEYMDFIDIIRDKDLKRMLMRCKRVGVDPKAQLCKACDQAEKCLKDSGAIE